VEQAKDQEKRARKKDKVEEGQKGTTHQRKGWEHWEHWERAWHWLN